MNATMNPPGTERLRLRAGRAASIMNPEVLTIQESATLQEAVLLFAQHGYGGLPVLDDENRPVGVLSQSDILRHDRRHGAHQPAYYSRSDLTLPNGEHVPRAFQIGVVDRTLVRDVMTPVVYSVRPDAPVSLIVEQMVTLGIHRVFVVDRDERLLGIVSAIDVLRRLGL